MSDAPAKRLELLQAPDDDLDYAEAELHYTGFESCEAFEEFTRRHGFRLTVECPNSHFSWVWVAPDGMTLKTHRAPFEGREGYLSYTFLRGPAGAAESVFDDLVNSANYIKGEFSPLTVDDGEVLLTLDDARPDPDPDHDERDQGPDIQVLFDWLHPPSRKPAYANVPVSIPGSDAATLRESDYDAIPELPSDSTYGSGVGR